MGKATKLWVIMAAVFILLGCIIFGSVLIELNFDFTKLSTVKYEENAYTITDTIKNISINTNTADIIFKSANECKVICYEETNAKHTVNVENNTLKISVNDQRKWYEMIGFSLSKPEITVYLPQNQYASLTINQSTGDMEIPQNLKFQIIDISASTGDVECSASVSDDLKIKLSTGDIELENISAKSIDLAVSTGEIDVDTVICEEDIKVTVSTGDVSLDNISCRNLISSGDTGDFELSNVIASEKFSLIRTTGDIELDRCDAAELYIKTDTGHVKGSLLGEKIFITHTDTGRVNVPKTVSGGKCEITTDTGDIKIICIVKN